MKKSLKLSLGSVVVAGALGAILIPATSASAVESFVCAAGTDAIDVPFAFSADNTPELAGTVCVVSGTTLFDSVNVTDGWSAEVKSDGTNSNERTDVRFTESDHPRPGRAPLRARSHGDQVAPPRSERPPPYPPSGGGALGLRAPGRNAPETRSSGRVG